MTEPTSTASRSLPRHLPLFFLGGFVLSTAIDLLFWNKPFGLSYALWIALVLVVSLLLSLREGKRLPLSTFTLMPGVLLTAAAAVWRMETGTRAYNVLASLGLLALTCDTLLTGGALRFRLWDAFLRLFLLVFAAFERPIQALVARGERKQTRPDTPSWRKQAAPYLRGVLIALPVLALFSALLASADPIFEQLMRQFFAWLRIDDWAEFLFRAFYIFVLGLLFSGLLLHAFSSARHHTPKSGDALVKPFLGKTEAFTVLVLIEALFLLFLIIQLRYFFGGNANINLEAYTYAEYARKGTNELIAVAILSLFLFQTINTVTRTPEKKDRLVKHILLTVLIAQVLIILLSAFQRLSLYEAMYGFTRIRVRTHLFILWLSALLFLVVISEWLGKSQRFFGILVLISLGFVLSQAALNIDQYIVERNLARLSQDLPEDASLQFDHTYLPTLSYDSVPAMLAAVNGGQYDPLTTEMLRAELYCRQQSLEDTFGEANLSWYSKDLPAWRAYLLLQLAGNPLDPASTVYGYEIKLSNGETHHCARYGWID
jgi:hypothetical protein